MDDLLTLLHQAGVRQYGQERVSQLAHALQCAALAEQAEASPALIIACLLHDIGHLVDGGDAELARQGIDAHHEARGAHVLKRYFGPAVTDPVRLHVDAKRYLCAVDDGYYATLSPASVRSLAVQGGVLTPEQAAAFLRQPYAEDAVALRRWDEQAKDPQARPPDLEHFEPYMRALLTSADI
jgi:phosphonate degradation associated HDIG domain protein